jgi:two-component system response regulator PilR (NtrC family)
MESEFFGHRKGSFTGAHQDKAGLFQQAEGGTLFFDEVADLPLDMQVKLLRAIQEKSVRPVGAQEEILTDVRILCATHKALDEEVKAGRFRQDLFYRLNVIQLAVPALRERREDIPLLTKHLLHKLANGIGLPPPTLSPAALNALQVYAFPGNVRELENILERAFTLTDSDVIDEQDLLLQPLPATPRPATGNGSDYPSRCQEYPSLDAYLEDIEREVLCHTLEAVKWNKTLAARELGITFRSLRYRLQKLGLDRD